VTPLDQVPTAKTEPESKRKAQNQEARSGPMEAKGGMPQLLRRRSGRRNIKTQRRYLIPWFQINMIHEILMATISLEKLGTNGNVAPATRWVLFKLLRPGSSSNMPTRALRSHSSLHNS